MGGWKKAAVVVGKWAGGIVLAGIAGAATDYVRERVRTGLDDTLGKPGENVEPKDSTTGDGEK